jgi:hypothetical protein
VARGEVKNGPLRHADIFLKYYFLCFALGSISTRNAVELFKLIKLSIDPMSSETRLFQFSSI